MNRRDPQTGRFLVGQKGATPAAPVDTLKTQPTGSAFTGLDPFTAALVARAPRVEPAQPMVIPAAVPAQPQKRAETAKSEREPNPVLVGSIGAALGLGLAAFLRRGIRG